ncbi:MULTISPECIES: hypothetical protein [Staphylococcus]|uniref:hypothetical protein n=1 Tax=Staphylococcus TaxID=1279 RepID=UPI000DE37044|nr:MULTISPECIES: hypothetical protein [Staphylococcus]MCO4327900.1 hypothetical protein [Staphylococcus agnetis]MDN8674504.1 hypothetical protein [Staphylococcus aureus]MDN8977703.1 hypothetical protein [Staphylococcus aureus]HDF3152060.1 hypothetical protein [Staphylococcus aureus]
MAKENKTTSNIQRILKKNNRFFVNIHGSSYGSKNGMFDIVMLDKKGLFVGIEAKSSTGKPYPNQLRRCREILEEGGRAIIAYPDKFSLHEIDNHELPKYNYIDEDTKLPKYTHELVLEGGEVYGK